MTPIRRLTLIALFVAAVALAGCAKQAAPAASGGGGGASSAATGTAVAAGASGAKAATIASAETTPLPRQSWKLPRNALLYVVNTNGPRDRKEVALTFDACESKTPAGFDRKIFDILKREDVNATIFIAGKWLSHNQEAAREIAADDRFEIGDHSWDHPDFTKLTPAEMRSQIERTDALIVQVTGKKPVLFRLPYGAYNTKVQKTLRALNVPMIQWDVVSGDPDPNVKAGPMTREILRRVQPGSIVIMHINTRGVHTHEALPGIISGLRAKGYDLVTVSALLR